MRLFACGLILVASLLGFALAPGGGIGGPSQKNTASPITRSDTGLVPTHQNANASEESKVVFHSDTVLVQVPVVVVDKQGNHVPGLTKEDFDVLENDKAQKIATFEEFATPNQRLAPETTAPNTFSNSIETQAGASLRLRSTAKPSRSARATDSSSPTQLSTPLSPTNSISTLP